MYYYIPLVLIIFSIGISSHTLTIDPEAVTVPAEQLLFSAIENHDIRNAQELLEQGTSIESIDIYGHTALTRIAIWGNMRFMKLFLPYSIRIDHEDQHGDTAEDGAHNNSKFAIADKLRQYALTRNIR